MMYLDTNDNPDIMEQPDIQWQIEANRVSEAYWNLVGNTCQWCGIASDMIVPRKTDNTDLWFLCGDCAYSTHTCGI